VVEADEAAAEAEVPSQLCCSCMIRTGMKKHMRSPQVLEVEARGRHQGTPRTAEGFIVDHYDNNCEN